MADNADEYARTHPVVFFVGNNDNRRQQIQDEALKCSSKARPYQIIDKSGLIAVYDRPNLIFVDVSPKGGLDLLKDIWGSYAENNRPLICAVGPTKLKKHCKEVPGIEYINNARAARTFLENRTA